MHVAIRSLKCAGKVTQLITHSCFNLIYLVYTKYKHVCVRVKKVTFSNFLHSSGKLIVGVNKGWSTLVYIASHCNKIHNIAYHNNECLQSHESILTASFISFSE